MTLLPSDRYKLCRNLGLDHDRAWFFAMHPAHARLFFATVVEMRKL